MNIVTVIQARRGSSRLPGKVLMPLADKTLLEQMVERVMLANNAGTIVIATTEEASDDAIAEICTQNNWNCYRGSTNDLLARHYFAAQPFHPDAVIKIPSDCPLIDPKVIERVIDFYLVNKDDYDFVSNLHPATYPDGNDVEIMTWKALSEAFEKAEKTLEREHTTPYIWERPAQFRLGNVAWETEKDFSMSHRFTIDYQADYDFIARVFDELYNTNPAFGLNDILQLLEEKPAIYQINHQYAGVNWYRNHLDELKTVSAAQTKQI